MFENSQAFCKCFTCRDISEGDRYQKWEAIGRPPGGSRATRTRLSVKNVKTLTNNPAPDARPSACQIVYRNYKLARALFPRLAVSSLAVFIPRLQLDFSASVFDFSVSTILLSFTNGRHLRGCFANCFRQKVNELFFLKSKAQLQFFFM